jgi:hypothetical protein
MPSDNPFRNVRQAQAPKCDSLATAEAQVARRLNSCGFPRLMSRSCVENRHSPRVNPLKPAASLLRSRLVSAKMLTQVKE